MIVCLGATGARGLAASAQLLPLGLAVAQHSQPAPQPPPQLRIYRTSFYELNTDVSEIEAREAAVRIDAVAAEFLRQTSGFKRAPPPPFMQFKLFRRVEDYEAAGGVPGSGGQYERRTGILMAVAGTQADERTWHRVQHEAFHQFAHHTLGEELAPWLSEGLAEYFAESVFTGDSLVSALVPEERRRRVVAAMREERFLPLERLLFMTEQQWNQGLAAQHYDQAWSLVLYLLHGENGRFAPQFREFLGLCSQGHPWQQAWRQTFGNFEGLERGWTAWWEQLPENPTAHGYREAAVRTLTSFFARAAAQGQSLRSFEEFALLGAADQLAFDDRQWLPPSLMRQALREAKGITDAGGRWMIRKVAPPTIRREGRPGIAAIARGSDEQELVLLMPEGIAYRGRFKLEQGRVIGVHVLIERLPEDLLEEFEGLPQRRGR